jgi:hypothetical protein
MNQLHSSSTAAVVSVHRVRVVVQIPSQNFLAPTPRGRRVSRRENALNLCFRPGSVNGQVCVGGPRRSPEETHSRGSWAAPTFRKSFDLWNKMARRESERSCGRRGAKLADGSRWGTAGSGTAGSCSSPRRLPARAPPRRSDHSPAQRSGGSPHSSGLMPGPGGVRVSDRGPVTWGLHPSRGSLPESPCSAGGAISWSRLLTRSVRAEDSQL